MKTGKQIIAHLKDKGFEVYDYNLVGVEDSDEGFEPVANDGWSDKFNDRLVIVTRSGTILANVSATTEPGVYYTKNPMNTRGAARIKFGQHLEMWARGQHKNQPRTLVQVGPVELYRDSNKSMGRSEGVDFEDSGLFGINLHTTSPRTGHSPAVIGRWSAGCVVVQSSTDYYSKIAPILYGDHRDKFSKTPGRYTFTLIAAEHLSV